MHCDKGGVKRRLLTRLCKSMLREPQMSSQLERYIFYVTLSESEVRAK